MKSRKEVIFNLSLLLAACREARAIGARDEVLGGVQVGLSDRGGPQVAEVVVDVIEVSDIGRVGGTWCG